jgi:hypothetical protein
MRPEACRLVRSSLLAAFAAILAQPLVAATYLPLSDADLAGRSPIIVRARVDSVAVRLERIDNREMPMTVVSFLRLETLKGRLSDDTFRVRLPGGRVAGIVWLVPGTPSFEPGQEVLLFLRPAAGRGSDYFLSEFGLGRFDIRADLDGRRFALRPAFPPEEDDYLSRRTPTIAPARAGAARQFRSADSLVKALKSIARDAKTPEIEYAVPKGDLTGGRGRIRPLWVNIGGREPGSCGGQPCLFRWFWDTGKSPNAVITVSGTQSNLSDSSNGTPHVENAVTQWHGVAASDVRYSGPSAGGNVSVQLDAPQSFDGGVAFNTPLPCGSGGVLGLGGPQSGSTPIGGLTFKGEANYFPVVSGSVTMRIRTGAAGCYNAALFSSAVLHEVGHTIGLGHSDQAQSTHSTTTPADWAAAVMNSGVSPSSGHPTTPQTDDIQAIQYYYGTGVAPTPTRTATLSVTPTRTPTGTSGSSPRGHVTPIHPPTPKSNVNGRQ